MSTFHPCAALAPTLVLMSLAIAGTADAAGPAQPARSAPPASDSYEAQAEALVRAMQAAGPVAITADTTWYVVRTSGTPCPEAKAKGLHPEQVFTAMPGVALIRTQTRRLPEGATQLIVYVNDHGRPQQIELTNMHGSCMVSTQLQQEQEARTAADATKNGRMVAWTAQLPAGTLRMSYTEACGIEEVVVRHPDARGGRENKGTGGYVMSCWWDAGDHMEVYDQLGHGRVINKAAVTIERAK